MALLRFPFHFITLLVLLQTAVCVMPAWAEDAKARADRLDGLIEALNADSRRRGDALEVIYAELRGPNSREMHEMLRKALSRENTLILQGVIEGLAMQGDPQDVPAVAAVMATSDKLEVRLLAIRLLPAFSLSAERARLSYILYAAGYEHTARPGVLEQLRRPPLTRRGRFDSSLEYLQTRIIRILASQFDPVGAALEHIDNVLYRQSVRLTVEHFIGNALGNDPSRWARIWAAQGGDMDLRVPDEVEEIRLAALTSLSDMGAEGLPEVIAAFRLLHKAGGNVLPQAAFETMRTMCRSAFDAHPALAIMQFNAEDRVEAENWRRRRYASTTALIKYTVESAFEELSIESASSTFVAAAAALGVALSYPAGFSDPDGILADVREKGIGRLERLLLMPDLSREKRSSVIAALAEVGTLRAVAGIASIVDSSYSSPEHGNDGVRLAEAAVDALRNVAVGESDGRDEARRILLGLLTDERMFAPVRAGTPPVGMAHMALWRLQRLGRSNDIIFSPDVWRTRLGW